MSDLKELLSDKILGWVDNHSWLDESVISGAINNAFEYDLDVRYRELVELSKAGNDEYRFTVNFEMKGSHRDASLKLYETLRAEVKGYVYYNEDKTGWVVNDAQGEYKLNVLKVECH